MAERFLNAQRKSAYSSIPSTGSSRSTSSSMPSGGMPEDLVADASRRLGLASLVWTGLWALALFLNNFVVPVISPTSPMDDAFPIPGNPVGIAVIVVSLALFAYTRRSACDCEFSLNLGLGYEVFLALAVGLVNQWTPNTTGVSWIAVLILVQPVLVPNTPGKTAIAALAAASMDPLGAGIAALRDVEMPPATHLVWYALPNYVAAGLAVLESRIIAELGRHVRKARELGSYRLGELLGRGGMGEVYRADHTMLMRPAAIKLIRPEVLGAVEPNTARVVVSRFKREAQAASALHSPHTIQLYDFGVTNDGAFYYVMEMLDGLDLENLVKRFGPMPVERAIHLLMQVCDSLDDAHAEGLIHRDIKPANIYACRFGREVDFVKVLDFGLVKSIDHADSTLLTAPDMTTGTPAFMAPEVAKGEREIDGRVDIYALGCVAYWLVTGALVFDGDNPQQIMYQHIQATPVPPSKRTELTIPKEFDAIVLDCLEKDATARPQTAAELAQRLGDLKAHRWTQDRARQWWQKHAPAQTTARLVEVAMGPATESPAGVKV